MSLRGLGTQGSPLHKPVGSRKRLRQSVGAGDSSSDNEDNGAFTGSSPLKDPPSALGNKQGFSTMESIAAATEQVATTLASGLMHAVANATRSLGVAGQTKLDAMQAIADGIKSQLNTKLEAMQAIADGIQSQLRSLGEEQATLRDFTDWVPEWGVLNPQQKVECICCSLHFALHGCPNKNHKRCLWLHQNGGRGKDAHWRRAVERHEESDMHKWCAEFEQSTKAHPLGAIGAAMDKPKLSDGRAILTMRSTGLIPVLGRAVASSCKVDATGGDGAYVHPAAQGASG